MTINPKYPMTKYYDEKNNRIVDDAPKEIKDEFEDVNNGVDWMVYYRKIHPEMKAPYLKWNGEFIDIAKYAK